MLLPFQLPKVSADSSDTNTDRDLKQKNTGSGDSANFNCGENLIDFTVSVICLEPPPPPETATLSVCKEVSFGQDLRFTFTVTGNNPFPAQFTLGDEECIDVTIGPGRFTVTENNLSPFTTIRGDCVRDPNNRLRATGEIQAGESQECIFINDTD
jgi:hypothetical protein